MNSSGGPPPSFATPRSKLGGTTFGALTAEVNDPHHWQRQWLRSGTRNQRAPCTARTWLSRARSCCSGHGKGPSKSLCCRSADTSPQVPWRRRRPPPDKDARREQRTPTKATDAPARTTDTPTRATDPDEGNRRPDADNGHPDEHNRHPDEGKRNPQDNRHPDERNRHPHEGKRHPQDNRHPDEDNRHPDDDNRHPDDDNRNQVDATDETPTNRRGDEL
eukprot:Skav229985  [mRNA]  locus=scaffold1837:69202:71438:- [translate_table: standard]